MTSVRQDGPTEIEQIRRDLENLERRRDNLLWTSKVARIFYYSLVPILILLIIWMLSVDAKASAVMLFFALWYVGAIVWIGRNQGWIAACLNPRGGTFREFSAVEEMIADRQGRLAKMTRGKS